MGPHRPRDPAAPAARPGEDAARAAPRAPGPADAVPRAQVLRLAGAVGNRALAPYLAQGEVGAALGGALARAPDAPVRVAAGGGPSHDAARRALAAADPGLIGQIPDLRALSEDTRIELIELCNRAGHDMSGGDDLERLWDSFGPDRLGMMGLHHWETFLSSLAIAPDLEDIPSVDALERRFRDDVRQEALRRLETGAKLVADEIARLEPMEQLPLEEQMNATYEIQTAAYQFERAQKAAASLRGIRVRGDQMGKRPDPTRTQMEWFVEPAFFDPADPPESTTYDDPATDPWVGLPLWQEVKWFHDQLAGAMLELADAQPALHVASGAGTIHEIAIAPEPRYILEEALKPLRDSETSIAMARFLIEGDEIDPLDLSPVVEAVRFGQAIPHSRTPWHGLFYRWVASETIGEHSRDETIDRLILGGSSFALILLGGWAGGLAGAALMGGGIGLGFYQAGRSIEHAGEMEAMDRAKGRIGDDLVAPGAAAAARATAIVDTVVAFMNLLPLAALGRGAGAARGGAGAAAGGADDALRASGGAAGAADDVARAATGTGRAATVPGTATVPPAPTGAAGAPPPAAAGGGAPGVRPMSVREARDFFTRALKRPSPLSEQNVELAVDRRTFELAWRNSGGGNVIPPAFTDQVSGRIWVAAGSEDTLLIFHESIHQLSITSGSRPRFLARFGSFLEEGVTEGLTRRHLGPQALRNGYDRHVRFVEMMEQRLGVPAQAIERAYIDGEVGALEAAIRAGLGGDADLSASFLMSLRNIGTDAADTVALRDALYIMFMRATPP